MTKTELIAALADKTGVTKAQAGAVLDALTEEIIGTLKNDDRVTLPGLGIFSLGQRAARQGRNPQTGQMVDIPAAKTAKFKALKALKDELNK